MCFRLTSVIYPLVDTAMTYIKSNGMSLSDYMGFIPKINNVYTVNVIETITNIASDIPTLCKIY